MAEYATRQSTFTTGDIIEAAHANDEFDQILAAFNATTGHKHDGTAGGGAYIDILADVDANNKLVADTANNRFGVFVEVTGSPVEQIRFQDGAIVPVTDNDIDLGTGSLEFKDAYFDGTVNTDSLVADTADINAGTVDAVIGGTTPASGIFTTLVANTSLELASGATVTAILDEDTLSSDSDTALATQQSIKAYVDSQVTAQDLDFQADLGGALSIDLDSETLTLTGGTGINTSGSGNTVTFAIDNTVVATLTDSQTLTNKILTAPVLNGTLSGTAFLDEDTMSSDSATAVASQQSIKAYVDAQVATANELSELTDVNITSPADASLLFYDTGTSEWIDNVVSGDITIADTGVAAISSGVIVNADINASAAIDATKIHDGSITNTEFGYLNGVTSDIQTQLNGKASAGFAVAMAIAL